jgi:deazaflavin-dependent oxidoreductase (nitroreductase family)
MAVTSGGEELARTLGYPTTHPGPMRRLVQSVAVTEPASRVLSHTLRPADTAVLRATGERFSLTGLLAGLPAVSLVTTGARTGQPRPVPLVPVVTPTTFAVLGTNFGSAQTPAWVHNLLANPEAVLEYRHTRIPVRGHVLDEPERSEVLTVAARGYAGFAVYLRRASHRPVVVFALERRDGAGSEVQRPSPGL